MTASSEVRSTCPYCGVGCGVIVRRDGDGAAARVVEVRGDPHHPANFGRLCTKGSTLLDAQRPEVAAGARLLRPELRRSRDADREPVGWDEALDHLALRVADTVARHGPDSVAFYVSGQLLTEDYYAFNKLARALVGTNNIDSNSRLCMSSAVAGYKATLGADAPPACYDDIGIADCLFIAGSNAAWAHPVLMRRIEEARRSRPDLRIVVVDPRRTETAAMADLHLPILPGTDVALFNAMLHRILWEGWVDRDFVDAHTAGFDALRAAVRETTPAWAAQICGIAVESIELAARWFATSPATLSLYCQGLNQSTRGTDKNVALINLHLATGQIGRPGAGPLSLTGQPNAMGGRETGSMANLLPGHRDLGDPEHRQQLARFWNVAAIPARPGLPAVGLFDALERGDVRIVWIVCTNPVQSLPDTGRVRRALERAELVVVQEAYRTTATVPYADVLLPATTWPEKEGTVTNSERRISRVRAALPPPGDARADWAIAADFARRLIATGAFPGTARFDWDGPEAIWNEHRDTTLGRDLDIGGLSWALLERDGPQQWPYPSGAAAGRARLYEDGRFATADGRARFVPTAFHPVAEPVDARHPLRLTTGRLRDHWHGMSRSGLVPQLFAHEPEPALQLAPADVERRGLVDGELVRVRSRRGELVLPVQASDAMRAGQAFIAMHWGPEYLAGGVNRLTLAATDAVSHQPELKHAAIAIERASLEHRLHAAGRIDAGRLVAAQRALAELFPAHGYGCCMPSGRDDAALVLRLAADRAFDPATLAAVSDAFGIRAGSLLRYEDRRRGAVRWLAVDDGRLRFVLLAHGPTAAADEADGAWLVGSLLAGTRLAAVGAGLLQPGASRTAGATGASPLRDRSVCSCVGVTRSQIDRVLADAAEPRLEAVQRALSCGTRCGSCLPELRRIVASAAASAAAPAQRAA